MKKKHKTEHILEEPAAAYVATVRSPLVAITGHEYHNPSDFDLLTLARKGISKKAITSLAKQISLTLEEVALILHISERTFQRYTPETLIRTEYADKAIELARLYERGIEVMGNEKAFNSWIKSSNIALNGEVPFNLLDTHIGFTLVSDALGRIEHGIFS